MMTQSKNHKWWVLVTVCLAVFMGMLDITIVNVALPEIQKSFSSNFSTLQWVWNAYTLVYAMMLLPVSKLGDPSVKRVFLIATIFVWPASGIIQSDAWLNIFRGLGIGGAAMMSLYPLHIVSKTVWLRTGNLERVTAGLLPLGH